MSELQFSCSRIEDLAVAEQCTLLLSRERLVVILQGEQTLRCHPIDEFESCCLAKTSLVPHQQSEGSGSLIYLRTCDAEADIVIAMISHADAAEVCTTINMMRQDRAAKVGPSVSSNKFVWYRYYPRSVDHMLTNVVKWERNAAAKEVLPFPHGRLDMLRLHLNRSVMTKLSSHGDTRIDFSCDAVAVSMVADHHSSTMGSSSPQQNGTGLLFPKTAADAIHMAHAGGPAMHNNLVLILTDGALYLTKASGSVIARIVRSSLSEQTLSETVDGRQFLLLKLGEGQFATFQSKYCVDLGNTLNIRAASHSREPSIVRCGVSVDTAVQTETSLSELLVHPELSVLKGAVDLLQRQCSEKEITIKLLQRQIDNINQSRPLNKKGLKDRCVEENDILRHYVLVLEQSIDTFEEMKVRHSLLVQEATSSSEGNDSNHSVVSLRQALALALRREEQLQSRLHAVNEEVSQLSSATSKALNEIGEASSKAVHDFIAQSEKLLLEQQLEMLVQTVLRVTSEHSQRSVDQASVKHVAELKADNEALLQEVQRRDRMLTEVLQRAEKGGSIGNVRESMPRCDDVIERRERLLAAVTHLEQQSALIRAATEQAARSLCKEAWNQSVEKKKLEQQIHVLTSLGSINVQVSRVTDLESMLLDGIRRRSDSAVAAKASRSLEKELATVRCQLTTAQQTIKRLKHAVANPPAPLPSAAVPQSEQSHSRRANSSAPPRGPGLTLRTTAQANIAAPQGKSADTSVSTTTTQQPPLPPPPIETPTRQLMSPGAHVSLQKELENQRFVFEQRLRDLEMVAFRGNSVESSRDSRSPSQMGIVQPHSFDSGRVLAASTLHSHTPVLSATRARSTERSYYY